MKKYVFIIVVAFLGLCIHNLTGELRPEWELYVAMGLFCVLGITFQIMDNRSRRSARSEELRMFRALSARLGSKESKKGVATAA